VNAVVVTYQYKRLAHGVWVYAAQK
jgi:hypothetical protein